MNPQQARFSVYYNLRHYLNTRADPDLIIVSLSNMVCDMTSLVFPSLKLFYCIPNIFRLLLLCVLDVLIFFLQLGYQSYTRKHYFHGMAVYFGWRVPETLHY